MFVCVAFVERRNPKEAVIRSIIQDHQRKNENDTVHHHLLVHDYYDCIVMCIQTTFCLYVILNELYIGNWSIIKPQVYALWELK